MRWVKGVVHADGVRLAVRDSAGSGPTMVLVHGLGTSQRSWDRVAPLLAGEFRVVTYDQRGHGRSSAMGEYSIGAMVADLVAVLDSLGAGQPAVVGHSMGALVAVEAAARRACSSVVAVDGAMAVRRPAAATDRNAFDAQLSRPLIRLLAWASARSGAGTRLSRDELWRLVEAVDQREHSLDAVYDRLTCPVLQVLPSRPDPVPWGSEMLAAVDDAAIRFGAAHPHVSQVWLDSGHAIPLLRPAELADEVRRFVSVNR